MAPTTPQPSAVSSRLLSMKFMQRAAADTPPSSAESSSKRRKLSHAASPADDPFSQANVQAAMQEVEAKRAAAVERRAAEMQEARWVIDAPAVGTGARGGKRPLNVVYVGYGDIDRPERGGEEEDEGEGKGEDKVQSGRRVTGNYKRKEEKESEASTRDSSPKCLGLTVSQAKNADDSDSEEGETSDSASDTPRKNKKKKKGDAPDKRKKEVKLNKLVSISGGGGGSSSGPSKSMKCYACGGEGHKVTSSECPKKKAGKKRRSEG